LASFFPRVKKSPTVSPTFLINIHHYQGKSR
jgi:hypothetical protein